MNKRIKELIKQATEHDYTTWDSYNQKELVYYKFNQEKFAEFIIQECCQYLNGEAERLYALSASEHRPNFKENFELCAEKCYDNIQGIKEHFGIEEVLLK